MAQVEIQLGEHSYTLVPQRHAYLQHKLGEKLGSLGDVEPIAGAAMLGQLTGQVYELLKVFIPNLMPRWEFEGFGSPGAMEEGKYEEEADRSPTPDQIITAFEMAMKINRLDLVKHLKEIVGTDFLVAQMRVMIGEATAKALDGSQTSPSPNGESALTTSTPSSPTSE